VIIVAAEFRQVQPIASESRRFAQDAQRGFQFSVADLGRSGKADDYAN